MKKYIAFLIILFFGFFSFGCAKKQDDLSDLEIIKKRGYLIVGVKEDSPPFGFYNKKGELTGIDIELSREIAQNIFKDSEGKNIRFVPVTPQTRFSKLNSKEVDILVAIISINEKRKLIIDFSAPYFTASQKIMVQKNSKISHLQYFNTRGTLAVVLGTTGEHILRLAAPNARVVGVKTYIEAVDLLANGRVDAVLGDDCILAGFNNNRFKIVNRIYSKEHYGVAVRKSEKSKELLNIVNSSIASFLDDKKINALKKEFIEK